jgi:hypothetical protein
MTDLWGANSQTHLVIMILSELPFVMCLLPTTDYGAGAFAYLLYQSVYTECPRRNVPDLGRVFLMLKYTDITQNTYVQS